MDLRRQAGQLHPRETPSRVEVDPERGRHRREHEPRDLDPLAAKVAARAHAALAGLEREARLDATGKHVQADGGGRQGRVQHVERGARLGPPAALRRPGDLAVGELRVALHRAREARHRPGEPQVSGAPELAEAEPPVLEREGALERREIAEARAGASRGTVARGEAQLGAQVDRRRPGGGHERGGKPRRQGCEPALTRQVEADRVSIGPRVEPEGEARPCPVSQQHLPAHLAAPLVEGRVERHVLRRRARHLDHTPGDRNVDERGAPDEARQTLTEPFERRSSRRAPASGDDRRLGSPGAGPARLPRVPRKEAGPRPRPTRPSPQPASRAPPAAEGLGERPARGRGR